MTMINLKDHKLQLSYPCHWDYKVIGNSEEVLRSAVAEVMGGLEHSVNLSNTSSGGKYCSLRVELVVTSQQQRLEIFQALKAHRDVILVL